MNTATAFAIVVARKNVYGGGITMVTVHHKDLILCVVVVDQLKP